MYTTILLAAALQDWERYSPHALAARGGGGNPGAGRRAPAPCLERL